MPRIDKGATAVIAAKPANTLRTAWPAMMLPARRMEWLTGRTKYEISSMMARIGRSASGALDTQKRPRNPAPFLTKPKTVTAMKTPKPRTAVTAICDVGEKELGISARKFEKTMNMNSVKIYGKYFTASLPVTSSTIL